MNLGINETIRSYKIGEKTIHVLWGDITKLEVDAIVNAANSTLLGGGGVDGAIHRKAGRELLEECKTLCGCNTGDAKVTKGYNLPVKHIIHTMGPIWDDNAGVVEKDFKSGQLSSCYEKCLVIANNLGLSSVAFPCISTGIYHFPKEDACKIAIKSVSDNIGNISDVVFCCYESVDYTIYCRTLDEICGA